jgi:hypothetical protein
MKPIPAVQFLLLKTNHSHGSSALFILGLRSASQGAANRDIVFLNQSWSRCPAEKWVPALLEGVWTRALATVHESETPRDLGLERQG